MRNIYRGQRIADAIHFELEIDAQLIIRGFQELQSLDAEHGVYFLASQSLSQGLERMMKVVLFLSNKLEQGDIIGFGHDLEVLWQRVREQKEFKSTIKNKYLNKELKILSEFNKHARYFYLNIMDGINNAFDPQLEWERLEEKHFMLNPIDYIKLSNGDKANVVIKKINHQHIIPLEKIVCILSRSIVRYQVMESGWNVPLAFREFANYDKNCFGKIDYSTWPQCLECKYKPYKTTWKDVCMKFLNRLLGRQQDKSVVVSKINFDGIWPFRDIEEVRVIKRNIPKGPYYIISINGYLCALDGKTSANLQLPTPYRAGVAVPGCNTQPFLEIAKNL